MYLALATKLPMYAAADCLTVAVIQKFTVSYNPTRKILSIPEAETDSTYNQDIQ
jgi:hypothetical protein